MIRVEKIYSSRKEAIEKLDELEMEFSELVTIRYSWDNKCLCHSGNDSVEVILACYKSSKKGDYFIVSESSISVSSLTPTTYFGVLVEGQKIEEAIVATLFGEVPVERDIIVLTDKETEGTKSLIYLSGKWIELGNNGKDSKEPTTDQNQDEKSECPGSSGVQGSTAGEEETEYSGTAEEAREN